ncbi:MAG: SoxR reducing system RseC family protein [Spongiibacteraceae bacterium]|jgi:sigma-E factor negative regulatory protein RseC|nr:SoxR reducing system RseC family protein [Spongiibacteraceae bacterium]
MAILASGRVVATDDDRVWVETIRRSTCGSCSARKGCGHHLLASVGTGTAVHVVAVKAPLSAPVAVGDHVQIAIPERTLLAGVGWAYLLPLVTLLAGLLLGSAAGGESGGALGALIGLALGCGSLAWQTRRLDRSRYQPRVVGFAANPDCAAEAAVVEVAN